MSRLRAFAVPVLVIVMLVSGVWMAWNAAGRRTARQAGEEAARTAGESISALLSYQPATAGEALDAAARDLLTGDFKDTYTQLVKTVVVPDSVGRKITATAKVPAVAVVSAESDHVVLLAYVDQVMAADKEPPTHNNSSVRVTMDNVDGRWLISGFDPI